MPVERILKNSKENFKVNYRIINTSKEYFAYQQGENSSVS